jgi:hypothetical protein
VVKVKDVGVVTESSTFGSDSDIIVI